MGVIAPSVGTFLMDGERCPRVLFNSIKKSKESSIHQYSPLFPGAAQRELCGAEYWPVAVWVMWLVPLRGAVSDEVRSQGQ